MNLKPLAVVLKIFELLTCVAALIAKKLTDTQAQRLFKLNQKLSNEWGLLNSLSWSEAGNDFSIVTYGGYTLITAVFLLSRIIDYRLKQTLCEKLLLIFGIIFFTVEGCLVYQSVEHTLSELHTNAFILGGLSFLVALLFLIDVCCLSESSEQLVKSSQTEYAVGEPLEKKIFKSTLILPNTSLQYSQHSRSGTADEMYRKPTPTVVPVNYDADGQTMSTTAGPALTPQPSAYKEPDVNGRNISKYYIRQASKERKFLNTAL